MLLSGRHGGNIEREAQRTACEGAAAIIRKQVRPIVRTRASNVEVAGLAEGQHKQQHGTQGGSQLSGGGVRSGMGCRHQAGAG